MGWGAYHPSRATVDPQYQLYGYAFFCQCQEVSHRDPGADQQMKLCSSFPFKKENLSNRIPTNYSALSSYPFNFGKKWFDRRSNKFMYVFCLGTMPKQVNNRQDLFVFASLDALAA
jgi:hypothetical protein